MKKKKTLLLRLLLFILFVVLAIYLGRDKPPEILAFSTKDHQKVLPKTPEQTPLDKHKKSPVATLPPSASFSETLDKKPKALPSVPLKTDLTQPVNATSLKKRSVPETPPVVLPPEETSLVKLCGGEPISLPKGFNLTHGDLALVLLNVLALRTTQVYEEAFQILSSLHIGPVGGWPKTNPEKPITLKEAEEIRCSISLAFEDGSIRVGPSVVTTALNGFFQDLQVTGRAMDQSGITKEEAKKSVETGYQGGREGVSSSPF
ncbi:MAG: hypothetical protein GTN81_05195 [Proteobacteria bacterium]|nr:hypothetical protein [Pseudomonadota bacterium]